MPKKLYFDSNAQWSIDEKGDELFTGDSLFDLSTSAQEVDPLDPDNPTAPGTLGDPDIKLKIFEDNTTTTGKALRVEADAADTEILNIDVENAPFGLYSVVIRSRTTVNSGVDGVFTFLAYAGDTELSNFDVKESDYTTINNWESLGIGVDFHGNTGDQLKIVLKRNSYSGSAVIDFDQVKITPAAVAINAIR